MMSLLSARVDAEVERREMLVGDDVDGVAVPIDPLEVQVDAQLLRTGRHAVMKDVQPLPIKHLLGCDISLKKLHHVSE
jgi:hypothetical protein